MLLYKKTEIEIQVKHRKLLVIFSCREINLQQHLEMRNFRTTFMVISFMLKTPLKDINM